jgi:hypothetical protein
MIEALGWPAAVLVLGFGFMIIFRDPIGALLGRTKSLTRSGLETFDAPQLPAPAAKPDALSEFMGTYDNPLLREQEANIQEDLRRRGLTESSAAQKALIRSLAGTQILLLFEKVQAVIYASQIDALTYLNSRPGPVPAAEIEPFYAAASQRYTEAYAGYTFPKWLAFLQSWLLVTIIGDQVNLASVGREFLKWRMQEGRAGPFHG